MLFDGVPMDPLIVQRSVGENSGSLIGPLGTKGVKMVEGDWSIPRLWRYNCMKETQNIQPKAHRMPKTVNSVHSAVFVNTTHICIFSNKSKG